MADKKIQPTNPNVDAQATTEDKTDSRKTANFRGFRRTAVARFGRKTNNFKF